MDPTSKILFVDDDDLIRVSFKRTFSHAGFDIDTAESSAVAVEKAKSNDYAVVVTDYRMPNVNGFEATEELRKHLPDATFILLSGNCDLEMALDAVNEHGLSFVIQKPWDVDELTSTLRRATEICWERAGHRQVAASMVDATRRLEEKEARLREALALREDNVAEALFSSLELRDRETQKACRRVGAYALKLAEALGIKGQALKDLERGALLHDIGKIGVPDSILLKPGPLTEEEWAVMRTHSEVGARLIDGLEGMRGVRAIILHHHERWDGSGYPKGLSGRAICMGSRILSVVDTLDAIMSDRPYRKGATFEEARDEICRCSGTQFDPDVVAAFVSVHKQDWLALRDQYRDTVGEAAA